jgi:hypothetical protein
MMTFGNALFDLQREFGLYAESDFVFPLMSLAVIESTVRSLSQDLDFQELGRLRGSSPLGIVRGAVPAPQVAELRAAPTPIPAVGA